CSSAFDTGRLLNEARTLSHPGFRGGDRYLGIVTGAVVGCDPRATGCGTEYENYEYPPYKEAVVDKTNPLPHTLNLASATTAVHGGGITRAVIRVSPARSAIRRDYINYVDPNVPCSSASKIYYARAQWHYVDVNAGWNKRNEKPIYGWTPTRVESSYYRDCTTGSDP
ncbi:MAG: hypothetical protein M3253_06515, partial [Chloroflexota bacterium]|nr:hypothetical protein [Chloroflexota bacterium]